PTDHEGIADLLAELPALTLSTLPRPVDHALPLRSLHRVGGSRTIRDPSAVVPEVELGAVPGQVALPHVVEGAGQPPLQQGEVALSGVHVSLAPDVLLGRVLDGLVTGKLVLHPV